MSPRAQYSLLVQLLRRPASGRGVEVGAPQTRAQQMPTAEHVQRQVAVVIVIAVEEAAFLLAVQRHIGGVDVQHDLLGGVPVSFHKHIHQQLVDPLFPEGDLLVAVRPASGCSRFSWPASSFNTGSLRNCS